VEGELAALDGQGPVLVADGAKVAAVGAGLLGSEGLGLLLHEGAEGARGQATSGGRSDLLHGLKVDLVARARLTEDATSDDFAPPGGQVVDLLEFFSREVALRHSHSCLVLAMSKRDAFLLSLYGRAFCSAKWVLTSLTSRVRSVATPRADW
jgi:hypothetical protein